MTSVTINKAKYLIPTCWEEVTVSQYIKILTEWEPEKDLADRDYVKLFNILAGSHFTAMQDDIENHITLIDAIGWVVFSPFQFSKEIPKVITFHGKPIDIPQNIRELSIGQNIHLRREIEKGKVLEQAIPMACGIYLQPLIDKKKFDLSRAKEIAKEIEQMPIYLIHPIGFFLLIRALQPGRNSVPTWHRVNFNLSRILKKPLARWRGLIS